MRLTDYLSVPYLLEAETVEIAPRLVGPARRLSGTAGLQRGIVRSSRTRFWLLERRRIEMIVRMVGEGCAPPVPRPPLRRLRSGLGRQTGRRFAATSIALIDR